MVTSDPEEPKQREPLSRIEREVLEILERADSDKPPVTDLVKWKAASQRRQRQRQVRSVFQRAQERLTPGILLLMGVVLSVMALIARHSSVTPGLARVAAIAALVCLIVPFIMVFRRPSQPTGPKRWRGRDMVLEGRDESPIDAIRRWWKSRS
jgi:hypothetical protein